MVITIELAPEEEQNLRRQAERVGKDVPAYVQNFVCGLIVPEPPPLSDEEWERLIDELGNTAPPDAPLLSDYDVSRQSIYEGRY